MKNIRQIDDKSKDTANGHGDTLIKPFDVETGFTKMSNSLFDIVMPKLSPRAWKLLCLIVRNTTGWQKDSDVISYSQLKKWLGTTSTETVTGAIRELLGENADGLQVGVPLIIRTRGGSAYEATRYSLNRNVMVSANVLRLKNGLSSEAVSRPKSGQESQTEMRSISQTENRSTPQTEMRSVPKKGSVLKKLSILKTEEKEREISDTSAFEDLGNIPGTEEKMIEDGSPNQTAGDQRQIMVELCSSLFGAKSDWRRLEMARDAAESLINSGRTQNQLRCFGIWWKYVYSRGGSEGRLPELEELVELWDEAMLSVPGATIGNEINRQAKAEGRVIRCSDLKVMPLS